MIHSSPVAAAIARTAHAGQVDKQGRDYFTHHLVPVAGLLIPYGPHAVAAGYLHDILEDTEVTEVTLRLTFPKVVTDAVLAVTRREGESYTDMIGRAAEHPLGRLVKLADNWHNLSGLDALAVTDPMTAARLRRRYEQAREVLVHHLVMGCG